MPKRLRLLKVSKDGYLVGTGEVRQSTHILIPHEALVAVLTGLVDDEARQAEAVAFPGGFVHEPDIYPIKDAANYFRQAAEGIAWKLGVCSWNKDHRAIDHNPATPRLASE